MSTHAFADHYLADLGPDNAEVAMWFNAANHDPDAFRQPYRDDLAPERNDPMTFGRNGPHLYLGAWLALQELMKRFDHFELAGEVIRLRSNFIAGIKHMPVRSVGTR